MTFAHAEHRNAPATKKWCGPCLAERGHITAAHLRSLTAQHAAQHAAAMETARESQITMRLLDQAADPVVARAIARAAARLAGAPA